MRQERQPAGWQRPAHAGVIAFRRGSPRRTAWRDVHAHPMARRPGKPGCARKVGRKGGHWP